MSASAAGIPGIEVGPLVRSQDDLPEAMDRARRLALDAFGTLLPGDLNEYLDDHVDWTLSRALRVDGRIAGVYLLKEHPIEIEGDAVVDVEGRRGVEGVALVIDSASMGRGFGRRLREEPGNMGFDYVWGFQHKGLGNLDAWLKHRVLVEEVDDSWLTAGSLRPDWTLEVTSGNAPRT